MTQWVKRLVAKAGDLSSISRCPIHGGRIELAPGKLFFVLCTCTAACTYIYNL